jgi:hypothetical protein
MAPPALDLVLPLLLLILVCSSGAKLYPLLHFPWRHSPYSIAAAQRLSPIIESLDLGAWPLPDWVAKRANRRSIRLPHGLNRSGGVPEPDGPTSGDGSAGGGGSGSGAARVGGVVSIHGASGPWGRPHGPTEMRVVR